MEVPFISTLRYFQSAGRRNGLANSCPQGQYSIGGDGQFVNTQRQESGEQAQICAQLAAADTLGYAFLCTKIMQLSPFAGHSRSTEMHGKIHFEHIGKLLH